jgi:hypothetical protein
MILYVDLLPNRPLYGVLVRGVGMRRLPTSHHPALRKPTPGCETHMRKSLYPLTDRLQIGHNMPT